MKIIKALQKNVQTISKYQNVDLDKEIDKFISENQNLSEVELLDKIYSIYGMAAGLNSWKMPLNVKPSSILKNG